MENDGIAGYAGNDANEYRVRVSQSDVTAAAEKTRGGGSQPVLGLPVRFILGDYTFGADSEAILGLMPEESGAGEALAWFPSNGSGQTREFVLEVTAADGRPVELAMESLEWTTIQATEAQLGASATAVAQVDPVIIGQPVYQRELRLQVPAGKTGAVRVRLGQPVEESDTTGEGIPFRVELDSPATQDVRLESPLRFQLQKRDDRGIWTNTELGETSWTTGDAGPLYSENLSYGSYRVVVETPKVTALPDQWLEPSEQGETASWSYQGGREAGNRDIRGRDEADGEIAHFYFESHEGLANEGPLTILLTYGLGETDRADSLGAAQLRISKAASGQPLLFLIKGQGTGERFFVTISGGNSFVDVAGLTEGETYTVTEVIDDAYGESRTVTIGEDGQEMVFHLSRTARMARVAETVTSHWTICG